MIKTFTIRSPFRYLVGDRYGKRFVMPPGVRLPWPSDITDYRSVRFISALAVARTPVACGSEDRRDQRRRDAVGGAEGARAREHRVDSGGGTHDGQERRPRRGGDGPLLRERCRVVDPAQWLVPHRHAGEGATELATQRCGPRTVRMIFASGIASTSTRRFAVRPR
ncbi:MAG TPA: hypothetical protein VGS97_02830 [Actinocrinis sp.]|uniref:hypothetical protein n=1 Tax=Actinocrinis sp. TaxID=1920516 RepID=UPI002DDD8D34|nr:hypothetical protein [Actinocrinis sp.]HEV2343006.1 hypothetical protein [Actinocrinis sp.]